MKKCTCMGEDAYICQCHYDMIQKELADWKARAEKAEKELEEAKNDNDLWRINYDDMDDLIQSLKKKLAEVKTDRDNWKKNHCTLRKEYKALEKELINLRGEFKRTDNLIKNLYDKTIGKHPF